MLTDHAQGGHRHSANCGRVLRDTEARQVGRGEGLPQPFVQAFDGRVDREWPTMEGCPVGGRAVD